MTEVTVTDTPDGIREIVIRRTGKLNALKEEDVVAIGDAVRNLAPEVRCLVLRGDGANFSSGAFVGSFHERDIEATLRAGHGVSPNLQMLEDVRQAPVPSVAAIEGYCIGLAMDLAAVCDFRVAAVGARFSMPEIKLGRPVIADASIFPLHFGLTKAKEIILTGRYYETAELEPYGFFNQVTPDGEAAAAAHELAREMLALPAVAVASQRRIFDAWLQLPHREARAFSVYEYAITVARAEAQAALDSYGHQA